MALEETRTSNPSVKRPDEGELIVGLAVDMKQGLPHYVFGSNPPVQRLNAKGKPAEQDCVTLLLIDGTRARIGDGTPQGSQAAEAGTLVNVWIASGDRWSWGEARKERGKSLDIGDVVKWKLDRMEPSTTGGYPRKVTKFKLADPTPEQRTLAQKHRDQLLGASTLEAAPAGAGYSGDTDEAF